MKDVEVYNNFLPQSLGEALEAVAFSPDGNLLAVKIFFSPYFLSFIVLTLNNLFIIHPTNPCSWSSLLLLLFNCHPTSFIIIGDTIPTVNPISSHPISCYVVPQ